MIHNATTEEETRNSVKVYKCCEKYEVMLSGYCTKSNETKWKPMFMAEDGTSNIQIPGFKTIIGIPQCGSRQAWPIYHYQDSNDKLMLLPNGILRHLISHHKDIALTQDHDLLTEHLDKDGETHWYYDYQPGTYCLDKAAHLVGIFTGFISHISFMAAEIVMYVSLMAAFFWLNSLGYYIWKTFRSRNVFLRVTDGRKYCYYSCYAWGLTLTMAAIALFAHFMLDTMGSKEAKASLSLTQETIGWLGRAVFFTPVAFIILVNIFFYLTTGHVINQMSTYGRIHHKMKYSFEMFMKLFLMMGIAWLFLILSWLKYELVVYFYIVVNLLQAFVILYICVFSQRRVTFLLRQYCCCCQDSEPVDTVEWGEEMSSMNAY
ncbi:putative G-protein coupled receptor Mth-like 5 [Blattella germanica]|nr:putative G-protein coupled receptor Mth-like 5 [Blattella germanica]